MTDGTEAGKVKFKVEITDQSNVSTGALNIWQPGFDEPLK